MKFAANDVTFCEASDLVIVGSNPENADMSNPQGHLYGEAWKVVATNTFGDQRSFPANDKANAEAIVAALTKRAAGGKLPVAFDRWDSERPQYGSDAYVAYGQDDDVALERMEG